MFSNTFFISLFFMNVEISSRNILSIIGLISNIDPGKMQQSLSLSWFLGESTVNAEQAVFVFLFVFWSEREKEYLFNELPLEKETSGTSKASKGAIWSSSSETTSSVASWALGSIAASRIPSETRMRRESASVSRVPWKWQLCSWLTKMSGGFIAPWNSIMPY